MHSGMPQLQTGGAILQGDMPRCSLVGEFFEVIFVWIDVGDALAIEGVIIDDMRFTRRQNGELWLTSSMKSPSCVVFRLNNHSLR